jgi:predicted porin
MAWMLQSPARGDRQEVDRSHQWQPARDGSGQPCSYKHGDDMHQQNLGGSTAKLRWIAIAAALSVASGWAGAQSSVQVFGIIDAGVLTQSKSKAGGRLTRLETSGLRQSVWGLKGTEDLGGGLKAFFNLESHFDTDNGALHGTGDAAGSGIILFRRQANVGLSGDWGQLILGRQYGPALLAHIGTEPRAFKEQFSNLYAWAYDQFEAFAGPDALNTNNDVGIFMKNAVQYRHALGPVNFGVLYSFGEQAGSASKNSIFAIGGSYTGPVVLSLSYEFMKDAVTGNKNIEHTGVGAAFPFGAFTFKANYLNAKNSGADGVRTGKIDAWGVGVDYKWHPMNNLTVAYYDNKDKDHASDHTRNLVLSNDYFISKRTTLYAQLAYVDAKSGASFRTTIVADANTPPGEKTTLLNVGINHNF